MPKTPAGVPIAPARWISRGGRPLPASPRFAPRPAPPGAGGRRPGAQAAPTPGPPPFKEGDVVTFDRLDSLKAWLPPEFWANRDFFFYEGMKLEIGPASRDSSEPPEYLAATKQFAGQARIGPENSLEGYTAGRPFDMDAIDCTGDPQAGAKIAWNFDYQWHGDGDKSNFYYSYWDRGEELPLYYEGTGKIINLAHRVEPQLLAEQEGDLFRGEKRKHAFGAEVT